MLEARVVVGKNECEHDAGEVRVRAKRKQGRREVPEVKEKDDCDGCLARELVLAGFPPKQTATNLNTTKMSASYIGYVELSAYLKHRIRC